MTSVLILMASLHGMLAGDSRLLWIVRIPRLHDNVQRGNFRHVSR